jgi:hypothetical protein
MHTGKNINTIFSQSRSRRSLVDEYQMRVLGTDGQIRWAIALFCPDDESAKEYARQVVDGYDIELWQGDRKVETLKPVNRRARGS